MFAPFFCALRNVLSHTLSVFLCAAGQRLKSRKNVLEDIGEPQKHILHFIDNDACVDNIVSKFVMKNTKYMEIKYSWLREKWEDGDDDSSSFSFGRRVRTRTQNICTYGNKFR